MVKATRTCSRWSAQQVRLAQWKNQWQAEPLLFGQPAWFTTKKRGWGITPARWQGWAYAAVWTLVIAVPFLLLLGRHRAPEAAIWLGGSGGMLAWDVHKLARALTTSRRWPAGDS